jgi:hypothetical protein
MAGHDRPESLVTMDRNTQYSLIVSAKLNGIDPQACLRHVLTHIADYPVNRVSDLLPWNVADQLSSGSRNT